MTINAEGWFLYAHARGEPLRARLVRESFTLPEPGEHQVIVEPIYGCWEGNMEHALQRQPIDICKQRKESKVVIGNCGLVRVTHVGPGVRVEPGTLAVLQSGTELDTWGYARKVLGYDAPGTMGCLATRLLLAERELVPIPAGTTHDLKRWAAFGLRHMTAWANWKLAFGTYRLMVDADSNAAPHVWGWGGGTTLALLRLAKHAGCRVAMISGSKRHLQEIADFGITAVDRGRFPGLVYNDDRFAEDREYRETYLRAETDFLAEVDAITGGERVQIFADFIGTPVFRATLKAMSREAVMTTAGWKAGMVMAYLRAQECIDHHQFVHTHNWRAVDSIDAVRFAEQHAWLPHVDPQVFSFDAIPELAERFAAGELGMYPVFSINPER